MDKIEKIRQKIKELRELLEDHNYYLDNSEQALGYGLALDDIEKSLDTLSEEPDKSLEVELEKESPKELDEMIDDYFKSLFPNIAYYKWRTSDVYVHASPDGIRFLCDHFYELGQSQMPMPEDTVIFQKGVAEGRRLEREDMLKEAVEVTVQSPLLGPPMVCCIASGCSDGDKVRIVVLKEEEE